MSEVEGKMVTVNMLEAKTTLSQLVEAVESGTEEEIIIARGSRPAARLVPLRSHNSAGLIGIAQGKFSFDKETFDSADNDIADLFGIPPLTELPRP